MLRNLCKKVKLMKGYEMQGMNNLKQTKWLCSFPSGVLGTTDNLYESHVFYVQRYTTSMEAGQVCILEQLNQVCFR